ncbi:DUF2502 domain-containing protein [Pantoea sp. KPR_PJ]|uniref:DUF2502 domain-containing protein n=1 Tax=Pantoea sp. KPR_PJ TaxID=2738375 RepID=UPI003529817C
MRKTALLFGMLLLAGVSHVGHANATGASRHAGDRNAQGNYWDGFDWRSAEWWQAHHGRKLGIKGSHGYWNGSSWQTHRPQRARRAASHDKPLYGTLKPHRERLSLSSHAH